MAFSNEFGDGPLNIVRKVEYSTRQKLRMAWRTVHYNGLGHGDTNCDFLKLLTEFELKNLFEDSFDLTIYLFPPTVTSSTVTIIENIKAFAKTEAGFALFYFDINDKAKQTSEAFFHL